MHSYCYIVRLYGRDLKPFKTVFDAIVIFLIFYDNRQPEDDHDWLKRITLSTLITNINANKAALMVNRRQMVVLYHTKRRVT